jgi:tetratricopeptide (TPR) repeat protein
MKAKTFYAIILMMCSMPLFSQNVEDYLSRYQYQQAIDYLEQANDTSQVAGMQKVLCYNYLQNYPKAIEILLNLQEKYPEDMQIKMQLALCYNKLSMLQESITYFDELIKMDSANTYFKIQKADFLYQAGKYEQALEQYKYAFDEYNSLNLVKQIAFCYEKTNQWDSAKVYFYQVLRMDSTDQKSKEEIIKIDINQENYIPALFNSIKFLAGDTNNIPLNTLQALCFYYMEDYKNAIEVLEKCVQLGDTSLVINKYLGVSYFYSKQDKKAYPYLVKAYDQDTINVSVLYALATVNKNLENFPEAILLYEKLMQKVIPPYKALHTYYKNLAESYTENKEIQPAIENYKKALIYASDNQDMELLFLIADLYDLHVRDYELAIDYYKQYRESLLRYQQFLTKQDNVNKAAVADISDKLKYLDERIIYLEKKMFN